MSQLIFRQLFDKESSTYTYLLADNQSREAVIIDPVDETKDRDISIIEELDLDLKYILETMYMQTTSLVLVHLRIDLKMQKLF